MINATSCSKSGFVFSLQDVDIELPHLFLVFEFVPMNLSEYIRSLDDKPMPSETVKSLLYQVSQFTFEYNRVLSH